MLFTQRDARGHVKLLQVGGMLALALTIGVASPHRTAAQDFARIASALDSANWTSRSNAVDQLLQLPAASLPTNIRERVIRLLEQEALDADHGPPPGEGEVYGEYVGDLVDLVTRLHDPTSNRGLALLGIGTSIKAEQFLADQGAVALPALDEAWARSRSGRSAVLETLGMMLAAVPGNHLSPEEQGSILRRLLERSADALVGFSSAAEAASLVGALPLLERLVRGDPLAAMYQQTMSALSARRDSMSPGQLAARLRLWTTGMCQGATGARRGACNSVDNLLADAQKQIAANRPNPARQTLAALAKRATSAQEEGAFSANETLLITGNVSYLESRL